MVNSEGVRKRPDKAIAVRIPAALRMQLDEAVRGGGKSLNAEIIIRLMRSFEIDPGRTTPEPSISDLEARLDALAKHVEELEDQLKVPDFETLAIREHLADLEARLRKLEL